jgi:gliding motility-associated-like protein
MMPSCSLSVALNPQDCPCPFIAPPFTPTGSTACNGNAPASISVDDPGLGYTVNWYDAPNGGNLVGTTNPFVPASFGTYYAANVETVSACVGEVVAVTADEAAPITYTQTNTNCSSDLTNYTTDIVPNGGAGGFVVTATASVTPNGSGGFTLSNIAANTSANFTITDANGCQQTGSTVAPNCNCPTINPPTGGVNAEMCNGGTTVAISVAAAPAGYSIAWYNTATGGVAIATGNSFTPPAAGMYYAEMIETASGCASSRVGVELIESSAIVVTQTDQSCALDLLTYDATISVSGGGTPNSYTITTPNATVQSLGNDEFLLSNIAAGTNINFTATDQYGCQQTGTTTAATCNCPTINPPIGATNAEMCNGGTPVAISVAAAPAGYSIAWYNTATGGAVIATGNSFTPTVAGMYYAEMIETASGCTSTRVGVELIEASAIVVTQTDQSCALDLLTYDATISVSGGGIPNSYTITTPNATVQSLGNDEFLLSNIAAGTNINFTVTDQYGCQQTGSTVAPNCNCPTINPPTGGVNATMCNGGTTVAISVAAAPAGYSIAWYNTATGGTAIATGNSFTPPAAGIYYAEMIETASGCTSTRVGVELIESSAIVVTQTDQSCALDLLTYDATISVSGGGTPNSYTITTPNATVQSLGNDEFLLSNIAAGTNINFTATDQYGCQQTGTTTAATCNCPTINPPTGGVNATMCNGGTTVAISVAAAPAGYSIAWYNTATGGAVIATGNSFTPPAAGMYYAEMIETASGCASTRVGVELTTASPIIIAQNNATCALDLQTYDATINVSGGGGTYSLTAAPYLVTNNGGGNFVVSGISTNTNVSLTATDQNGCTTNGTSTAPVCNCPAVPLASNGQGSTTCFGDAPNPISVSAAPAGYTVLWFDAASSGNQLATGAVYQPNGIGTYYAALQDNASLCIGQTIAVVAAENTLLSINNATPVCATDLGSYAVSGDISGGTSPYTLSATLGNVTVNANGSFDIVNLTNNINSSLTATDAQGCSTAALVITAPNCNCPTIAAPTNPINNNYCFGALPTSISVDAAPAGFVINWYNLPAGGAVIATGNSFTPATAGIYYAEMLNTTTNCNSPRTAVTLTQTTELVVQQGAANCAANLLSYDVSLDVSGGTASYNLTATNGLTVTNNGGNNFTVNGVPTATAATVNVVDANGCTLNTTLNTVDCNCPTVVDPSNPQNAFYCFGDAPVALSVDAPAAGFSIVWYDAATGGSIVGNGNSFVPAQSGTYYAQTNQDGTNCSSLRVPATLTEGNQIIVTQVSQQCAADLSTYEAEFSVVGYSGAYTATATDANGNAFVVVDNGSGNVTVSGIAINATSPIFAFVDTTNCPQSVAITPADCGCGTIPDPINPQNNTYCSGSNPTELCVTLPNAQYEIRWYDSNQVLQANTPCFTPTTAGTYTATTIEVASGCESDSVTAVLTQTSPIVIDTLAAICATDLATYSYPIVISGGTSPYTVSALPATVSNNGGGNFSVDDIENGTTANISVTDANGCTANLTTNTITCNCPTVDTPVIANNALFYCADAAIPTATVTPAGVGFVIRWYDAANTLVGTGSSFTPTAAGIYTAVTESTTANCNSLPATVTFTEGTAITTAVVDNLCATNLSTYDLTISIVGGQTPYTFSNTTYTITPAAGNNYVVSGIANNTNATFTITDANDCAVDANFAAVNCNCPVVTAPVTNSTAYCEGSTPTALSATAPPTDYIVTWYSQSTGGTALATGETYTPSTAGTYYAAFTNPNNNCESPRTAATLSINPVAAAPTIVAPAPYCSGAPISPLTATNTGGTITWYSDAALTNQVATGNSFTPSAPAVGTTATYYATETSAAGCVSTPASVAVSVIVCNCTPPAAPTTANAALTYCIGQANTTPFVANTPAGITVRWYDAANNLVGTGNSFTATAAGTYQAQAYNAAEDCSGASIPFTLTGTSVTATIDPATATIAQAGSVSLTASPTNGVTYSWTPATTLNCADCGTVVASPIATTTYTVVITDQNGCTALATAFVGVENNNTVVIPNAFSPNGDNQNDVFHISGYNITTAELQVYNRWGQKVYSEVFTNLSNGWDGTFKGFDQELGVYVYYLSVTFNDGVKESYKGNVTLIR